jgi:hypothetical protein
MTSFPAALPHGPIEELFPGVFFVTGAMQAEFFGSQWQFSRNMTVVKEGDALTILNAVRLDDAGLTALDALGAVKHVVRVGAMHGRDDAFYVDRYKATYWALPNTPAPEGLKVDRELTAGGETPFSDCSLFVFEETKLPECVVRVDRAGGIAVACDALQNWTEADAYFDAETVEKMSGMGFFAPANVGPAWMQAMEPKPVDFERLKSFDFKHTLPGHGKPLHDTAQQDFHVTFAKLFNV